MAPFYAAVARDVDLSRATVFLLDEFGGLPRGDPSRCVSMIRRDLLDRLDHEVHFHWPDVDGPDPAGAARRYQQLIDQGGLDLTLIGLGGNGHIGMNEPGSDSGSPTRVVSLEASTAEHAMESYGAALLPTWGITLGMEPLLASNEIWLLVTGAHKAEILATTVRDPIGPDVPASFLREHPRARIFADASAASLIV